MGTLQSPQQFLEHFSDKAVHAKKRIYIQSMLFEYGKVLTRLESIFILKAKEGVDVHFTTDRIAQRYTGDNPNLLLPLYGPKRKHFKHVQLQNLLARNRLLHAGAHFTITDGFNPLFSVFPIFRRNHRKIYVVDDTVWVGGVNFFDKGFEMMDFMVMFTQTNMVNTLVKEFNKTSEYKGKLDYKVEVTEEDSILMDIGRPGKSIIYDEAITLIKEAQKSVTFVSQFIPDGPLLTALIQTAKRDVPVTVITDWIQDKAFHAPPFNIPYLVFKQKVKNIDNIHLFHNLRQIHAKLLIVDKKTAIFGSHNLVHIGVMLGTEEIALRTTNDELVKQLENFIETQASPAALHQLQS